VRELLCVVGCDDLVQSGAMKKGVSGCDAGVLASRDTGWLKALEPQFEESAGLRVSVGEMSCHAMSFAESGCLTLGSFGRFIFV
jgi:hypothetical protein